MIEKNQPKVRQRFEDWLILRTKLLYPFFRQRASQSLSEVDSTTLFYTDDRNIEIFTSIGIFLAGSIMFVVPLWILQTIHEFQERLIVITVFIFVFLTVLTSSTLGKPFEILAATAG